ncbi:hypothetical protein [uncultured Salinisphaera sp.]|uniref:hypothetical protein n=1 Tax=uncultured Salinisphaera sp. TaxID=359372 RepID=UPI0032B1A03D
MANNSDTDACFARVNSALNSRVDNDTARAVTETLCEADWHPHYIAQIVSQVIDLDADNTFVRELGVALKRDPIDSEIEYARQRRQEGADAHAVATEVREDDESIAVRNPPRSSP